MSTITQRECDTILAALRYWQAAKVNGNGDFGEIDEIATNNRTGEDAALDASEIDTLCERINYADAVMHVHIVEAEHFNAHGRIMRAFKFYVDAEIAATAFALKLVGETKCAPADKPPAGAALEELTEWLENFHGAANCYVNITTLPLEKP
jgi:hypothetical protein